LDYVNRLDSIEEQWGRHKAVNSPSAEYVHAETPSLSVLDVPIPRKLYNELDALIRDHGTLRQRPLDAARRLYEALDRENNKQMGETLRPVLLQWVETTRWFVSHVHDSGKGMRDSDYDWNEVKNQFELMEVSLRSVVGAFFVAVTELDDILEDTNT
jgi:hypothetical protein